MMGSKKIPVNKKPIGLPEKRAYSPTWQVRDEKGRLGPVVIRHDMKTNENLNRRNRNQGDWNQSDTKSRNPNEARNQSENLRHHDTKKIQSWSQNPIRNEDRSDKTTHPCQDDMKNLLPYDAENAIQMKGLLREPWPRA
jgi:hypothetical protein